MNEEQRDLGDFGEGLDSEIGVIDTALGTWRIDMTRAIPDLALRSYALDVIEYGRATRLLAASTVPRAAYAVARSALEAAQDALLLVSSKRDYDLSGAYIRAAELVEQEKLRHRFRTGTRRWASLCAMTGQARPNR